MILPAFTFNTEANGYLSDTFVIKKKALVHIELESKAPVLTMKEEEDGEFAIYGQTPEESNRYEITITSKEDITVKLATPVAVTKCYVVV